MLAHVQNIGEGQGEKLALLFSVQLFEPPVTQRAMTSTPRVHLTLLSAVKHGMAVAAAFHFRKTAAASLAFPRISLSTIAGTQSSLQTKVLKIWCVLTKVRKSTTCYARKGQIDTS